jgi:hypothetical protein
MPGSLSEALASAFLAGEWTAPELEARAASAFESRPRWLRGACRRVLDAFPERPADVNELALWLERDERIGSALRRSSGRLHVRRWFLPEPRMHVVSGPLAEFPALPIPTLGDLAGALSLQPAELAWFADTTHRNRARASEPLRHYRYRWVRKRSSGYRLLETPKPRIKRIQRWLLREVLPAVPVDAAAHGFAPGRSALTFVAAHVGQHVLVRLDLEDFFASIAVARVRALFRRVGYPHGVACALAGLCCVPTPEFVLRANPEPDGGERYRVAQRLRIPHLPQGAPTSPALSNLIAWRLDRRLSGLARAAGARYSRYADDLAFSGDRAFARGVERFVVRVGAIAEEEGFRLRFRKMRVMKAGGRQQLAGLVINERPNAPRQDYDALRAVLHNAARHGPTSQNRDQHPDYRAHLQGRIAWIEQTNPQRGARLQRLFERITWPDVDRQRSP